MPHMHMHHMHSGHAHHHHPHAGSGGTVGTMGGGAVWASVGLFIGAAACIGIAAVFFVIAQSVPMLSTSFTVTAAVLAPVGALMFVLGIVILTRNASRRRLPAGGIPGQAWILDARQTGLYVNGQPLMDLQLQIATSTGAPYTLARRDVVPMHALARLGSGQPLAIQVDPTSPEKLVILF